MGRYHHLALLFGTPYIRNDVRYMIVENECKVWKWKSEAAAIPHMAR